MIEEFYGVAFRKELYKSMEELQTSLNVWLQNYNRERYIKRYFKRCISYII